MKWSLHGGELDELKREIDITQRRFFGLARTMRASIAQDSVEDLLDKFRMGNAALHLARAAMVLGQTAKADALAERGRAMAGERASGLIRDLQAVREAATSSKAWRGGARTTVPSVVLVVCGLPGIAIAWPQCLKGANKSLGIFQK